MNLRKAVKYILPYGITTYLNERNNKKIKDSVSGLPEETRLIPKIFNEHQEEMQLIFLNDTVCKHSPYTFSSQNYSKYILWDRFNCSLPTHFYSHDRIFETVGQPREKYALLVESEAIVPDLYEKVLSNEEHMNSFKKIFTHSDRVLNKYSNAAFIPGSSVWYGGKAGGGSMDIECYKYKTKNISIVSSAKVSCDLHKYRLEIAGLLRESGKADTYGTFNGGQPINIASSLTDYRFSIVVENYISKYYFTEKILNCFASMTIPIYIGADNISDFFNEDGIIRLEAFDIDKLEHVLSFCSEDYYKSKIEAILDNYKRVFDYISIEDYIYENYLRNDEK